MHLFLTFLKESYDLLTAQVANMVSMEDRIMHMLTDKLNANVAAMSDLHANQKRSQQQQYWSQPPHPQRKYVMHLFLTFLKESYDLLIFNIFTSFLLSCLPFVNISIDLSVKYMYIELCVCHLFL